MEPWLGYAASAISVIALVSREAMTEVSLSDMEEMLRKQGRTQQLLPRVEAFTEHIRDTAFTFRWLDNFSRAIVAVALWLHWVDGTVPGLVAWTGLMLSYLVVLDIILRQIATYQAERIFDFLHAWLVGGLSSVVAGGVAADYVAQCFGAPITWR